jgi:hypothetical protein
MVAFERSLMPSVTLALNVNPSRSSLGDDDQRHAERPQKCRGTDSAPGQMVDRVEPDLAVQLPCVAQRFSLPQ